MRRCNAGQPLPRHHARMPPQRPPDARHPRVVCRWRYPHPTFTTQGMGCRGGGSASNFPESHCHPARHSCIQHSRTRVPCLAGHARTPTGLASAPERPGAPHPHPGHHTCPGSARRFTSNAREVRSHYGSTVLPGSCCLARPSINSIAQFPTPGRGSSQYFFASLQDRHEP